MNKKRRLELFCEAQTRDLEALNGVFNLCALWYLNSPLYMLVSRARACTRTTQLGLVNSYEGADSLSGVSLCLKVRNSRHLSPLWASLLLCSVLLD